MSKLKKFHENVKIVLLYFGNEYSGYFNEKDNLAIEIANELKTRKIHGLEISRCNSPDEILKYKNKKILILDTAKDIEKVVVLEGDEGIRKIKEKKGNLFTLHDFDLGFFLQLMEKIENNSKEKIRKICNSIKIICIPQKGKKNEIREDVEAILRKEIIHK
ncbi:hypothetical protein DRN73_08530 [Candidatus Pacearchaeota archaeon]|nr:MAG: hypothetical protein DRN73_08530 [Candidatus Pacearchaeota archaeon]